MALMTGGSSAFGPGRTSADGSLMWVPPLPEKTIRCDEETAREIMSVYREIMNNDQHDPNLRMQAASFLAHMNIDIYKEQS
jgi:hypothetical protein